MLKALPALFILAGDVVYLFDGALIMRRNLFARRLRVARHFRAHLIAQRRELALQLIDLRLLTVDGLVELFEQVFGQA